MSVRAAQNGQALVEVLAALVLFAIAGAIVASAAATNLRSVRAIGMRGRLTTLAARELALLQIPDERPRPAAQAVATEDFIDGAIRGSITRATSIDANGTLATLAVTVTAGARESRPAPRVHLSTRILLPW